MNLIAFFGLKIKPRLTRGKKMWHPLNNQITADGIICLRDKDVNCFLIKDEVGYVAIDSGYPHSQNVRHALQTFGIRPEEVKAVFFTHLDLDHAGGMDENSEIIFPQAQKYLSLAESKYLTGEYCRKKVGFIKCKLPIKMTQVNTLRHGEVVMVGNLKVEAVYAVGHTLGHTAYLVNDKWLFTGDCLIANETGGWCFYDFWNVDTALNIKSISKLQRLCTERQVAKIFTAHSGVLAVQDAFRHAEESPKWRQKHFVFCQDAEVDPYR